MDDFDSRANRFREAVKKLNIPDEVAENFIASKRAFMDRSQPTAGGSATLTQKQPTEDITQQAIQGGANPQSLAYAKTKLGSQEYFDLCQGFVENASLGHRGVYGSATQAWQSQQGKAKTGLAGIKEGDLVYFSGESRGLGHTGVYAGNGQFISATPQGVQQMSIDDWERNYGQKLLGYIPNF